MDTNRIQTEFNKVKNLHQYRNYSVEQLQKLAYSRAIEYHADIESLFTEPEDKKLAKSLLKKYLRDYTPETVSDINTLRSIIYLELLNTKFQDEINRRTKNNEDIPLRTVETIHKNLNEILTLKDSLGISKNKRDGDLRSADKKIMMMRKQFKIWLQDNQASRQTTCPECGQMVMFRIRTEHWEAQKHPFFKDRILYNKSLIDLHLQGRVSKEELAKILECSPDYIDWVIERVHKNHE